jgi:integrase
MSRKTIINSITSPELIAQINPDNARLKDDFLEYLKSVQRSPGTIAGYRNDLEIFFVWVLQNAKNKFFVDVSKRDLVAFQNWMINENKNSPSRVRRIKAAISSLSNFVENILDDEPEFRGFRSIVRKIENPALQPVREKTVWEDDELEELLDKLVEKQAYDRACYLALAMYSGRRKSELCRFRVSDFDDDKLVCDGALYKSSPIKTKGRSGGKFIPCYTLAKKFKPYLQMWLDERKRIGLESEWLFPLKANPAEHIGIATANSWANAFTRLSGRDFYAHSIRHYFTTSLARAGIPDGVIQAIQGWETLEMVRVYDDTPQDEQIGAYFKNGEISAPKAKSLTDL